MKFSEQDILHFYPLNILTSDNLQQLLSFVQHKKYAPGEVIFSVGEANAYYTYLYKGTLSLHAEDGSKDILEAKANTSNSLQYEIDPHKVHRVTAKSQTKVELLLFDSVFLEMLLPSDCSARDVPHKNKGNKKDAVNRNATLSKDKLQALFLSIPVFQRLSEENLDKVLDALEKVIVSKGDKILEQGDDSHDYYYIQEGQVDIHQHLESGIENIFHLQAGKSFGEEAAASSERRNATVIAATDCILWCLPQSAFLSLILDPLVPRLARKEAMQKISHGSIWLDVRTEEEYNEGALLGSLHIPLFEIRSQIDTLEEDEHYIVCCDTGSRSSAAAFLLLERGFSVSVISGGLLEAQLLKHKPKAAKQKVEESRINVINDKLEIVKLEVIQLIEQAHQEAQKLQKDAEAIKHIEEEEARNISKKASSAVKQVKAEAERITDKINQFKEKTTKIISKLTRKKGQLTLPKGAKTSLQQTEEQLQQYLDEINILKKDAEELRENALKRHIQVDTEKELLDKRIEETRKAKEQLENEKEIVKKNLQKAIFICDKMLQRREKVAAELQSIIGKRQEIEQRLIEVQELQTEVDRAKQGSIKKLKELEILKKENEAKLAATQDLYNEVVSEKQSADKEIQLLVIKKSELTSPKEQEKLAVMEDKIKGKVNKWQHLYEDVGRKLQEVKSALLMINEKYDIAETKLEQANDLCYSVTEARQQTENDVMQVQLQEETIKQKLIEVTEQEQSAQAAKRVAELQLMGEEHISTEEQEALDIALDEVEQEQGYEGKSQAEIEMERLLDSQDHLSDKIEAAEKLHTANYSFDVDETMIGEWVTDKEDEISALQEQVATEKDKDTEELAEFDESFFYDDPRLLEGSENELDAQLKQLLESTDIDNRVAQKDIEEELKKLDGLEDKVFQDEMSDEELNQLLYNELSEQKSDTLKKNHNTKIAVNEANKVEDELADIVDQTATKQQAANNQPQEVKHIEEKTLAVDEILKQELENLEEDIQKVASSEIEDHGDIFQTKQETLQKLTAVIDTEKDLQNAQKILTNKDEEGLNEREQVQDAIIQQTHKLQEELSETKKLLEVAEEKEDNLTQAIQEVAQEKDAMALDLETSQLQANLFEEMAKDIDRERQSKKNKILLVVAVVTIFSLIGGGYYFSSKDNNTLAKKNKTEVIAENTDDNKDETKTEIPVPQEDKSLRSVPEQEQSISKTEVVVTLPVKSVNKSNFPTRQEEVIEPKTTSSLFTDHLASGGKTPVMVIIPTGSFTMGDRFRLDETPAHKVDIHSFAMSQYEVTYKDFKLFAQRTRLRNSHYSGKSNYPVTHVTWKEAKAYVAWLSKETGHHYRLPSEAEWEYAAAAGAKTEFWWGDKIGKNRANCFGCKSKWDNKTVAPVGQFKPNSFGLYDTAGNAAEWVEDCYYPGYPDVPGDGGARVKRKCKYRVVRGGAYNTVKDNVRYRSRAKYLPATYTDAIGFRIARDNK